MPEMPWKKAILQALKDAGEPMHYADIAQAIIDHGYRESVGATPAATVAANLSESMKGDPKTPFVKVERGVYGLRQGNRVSKSSSEIAVDEVEANAREMGLINAFGMFWSRSQVMWQARMPRLLGVQQTGSTPVNFTEQAGVYVLYDVHRPVYVGRVTEPRMGLRLFDHTRDRLTSRWDRFSWFGVRGVAGDGSLAPIPIAGIAISTLIATMEALLIEGLEPPQNRRQGDGFNAVEFIQSADPELEKRQRRLILEKALEM